MFELNLVEKNEIKFETSQELVERSIFLAFTTRQKGVSEGNFQSLNLALHVNDLAENVKENRALFAKSAEINPSKITCCEQIHGNKPYFLNEIDIGAGNNDLESAIKKTDALITDIKNVPLMLFFADCLPIVIVSLKPKLISVIHAGHKGLLKGVIKQTFNNISNRCEVNDTFVFLGPSIGSCCYGVDRERVKLFSDKFPSIINEEESCLDLKKIASFQLNQIGIKNSHIISSKYCTCCNEDLFFSYRRSSVTGRQAAVACITE